MGYFVLDLEEPATKQTRIKAAIANLELYLESGEDYLLTFAEKYISDAIDWENNNE